MVSSRSIEGYLRVALWSVCAHMEYVVAAVVCLFLMLRYKQDSVDQF